MRFQSRSLPVEPSSPSRHCFALRRFLLAAAAPTRLIASNPVIGSMAPPPPPLLIPGLLPEESGRLQFKSVGVVDTEGLKLSKVGAGILLALPGDCRGSVAATDCGSPGASSDRDASRSVCSSCCRRTRAVSSRRTRIALRRSIDHRAYSASFSSTMNDAYSPAMEYPSHKLMIFYTEASDSPFLRIPAINCSTCRKAHIRSISGLLSSIAGRLTVTVCVVGCPITAALTVMFAIPEFR